MPIAVQHRQHVGVNGRLPVLAPEKSEGETDQLVLIPVLCVFIPIKGSDENVARRLAGYGQREGQGVFLRYAPYFFLHGFQLREVVDGLEVANHDRLGGTARRHG